MFISNGAPCSVFLRRRRRLWLRAAQHVEKGESTRSPNQRLRNVAEGLLAAAEDDKVFKRSSATQAWRGKSLRRKRELR